MIIKGYTIEPRAKLKGADLQGANLQNADLTGADLEGTIPKTLRRTKQ